MSGREGWVDFEVTATSERGGTGVVVEWVGTGARWDARGYVLAPAMVYDGNRFEVVDVPYSPFWPDASHYAVEKAPTITRQPCLLRDGSAGRIELDSLGVATPALGWHHGADGGRAFLAFCEPTNELGPLGLTFEEEPASGVCRCVVGTPRARQQVPGHMGFQPPDPDVSWVAGQRVALVVRVWCGAGVGLQGLFDRYAEGRKDFGAHRAAWAPPLSVAAGWVREKVNALNWDEVLGYYRHGITRENAKPFDWWQLGWVSGGITTLPMLAQGDATAVGRARRNLDFMFCDSAAAHGLWRAHHDGTRFNPDDPRPPRPGYQVSVRRLGDGLYYGLKQVLLLAERGEAVPAAWEESALQLAGALARVFESRGQLGQYLDSRTGDILMGGSTAGGGVPAGLVLAARRTGDGSWLERAVRVGEHFVATALERGITNGGPCDALGAPDSEACFALLVSFVELHQATGDARWARAARDLTRQYATWVTSYDVDWPEGSDLGRAGVPSLGTVWANVQNKHAAPGICTYSGEHLFRHWRATGDELALDLLRDTVRTLPHYVSRTDVPLGRLAPGMMCERVNISDWEGPATVGGNLFGSTIWVETAMMLTAAELPGVYVRSDTGRVVVLDQVEASWGEAGLTVSNPTAWDAVVAVLVEEARQAVLPLRTLLTDACRMVRVPAGGSRRLSRAELSGAS